MTTKFVHNNHAQLDTKNLNVYINGAQILKDVNVSIPKGKITCIIGPSGCGKSTLLRTFNRLNDRVEGLKMNGEVNLGDNNILKASSSKLSEVRRNIGLVPQRPCPLPMSGGQQQRLCLARSLAVEPSYLLADESTSALDPISSKKVEQLFTELKKDYSIVMVTHTLRQALRIADHVIFMYLGEVIEEGSAEEVFHHPKHELTQKYLNGAFS